MNKEKKNGIKNKAVTVLLVAAVVGMFNFIFPDFCDDCKKHVGAKVASAISILT